MIANFGTLGLFLAIAILVPLVFLGIPFLLKFIGVVPRKPGPVKNSIYECGMEPIKEAWTQFNFRYYTFAILFVALDVMAVFLFPWAANYGALSRDLKVYGLVAVVIFILILVVGFVYAWKKKALEWQ